MTDTGMLESSISLFFLFKYACAKHFALLSVGDPRGTSRMYHSENYSESSKILALGMYVIAIVIHFKCIFTYPSYKYTLIISRNVLPTYSLYIILDSNPIISIP